MPTSTPAWATRVAERIRKNDKQSREDWAGADPHGPLPPARPTLAALLAAEFGPILDMQRDVLSRMRRADALDGWGEADSPVTRKYRAALRGLNEGKDENG